MLSQQLLMLLLPGACTDLPLQLKGLTGPLPSQSGACPPAGLIALPCPALPCPPACSRAKGEFCSLRA